MFTAGWCGGVGVAGWLFMALIWGGFLAVVVWAVLWLFPSGRRGSGEQRPPGQDAAADLDRKLAVGEIDADTYLRQRDTPAGMCLLARRGRGLCALHAADVRCQAGAEIR